MKITYTLSIQQWQQWHKDRKVILNFTNGSIVIHLYYVNFLYGKIPIYQCAAQIICTDCGFRIELSVQFNSVAQSCPTLCNPMNRNTPGLPVHHQLPESVMPYSHLILCHPLLFLPSIFPSIRVFSNESALHIRWPEYWSSASTSVPPVNTQDWSLLGWTGWISLQSKGLSRVFSNTAVQKHQFFGAQLSSQSNSLRTQL